MSPRLHLHDEPSPTPPVVSAVGEQSGPLSWDATLRELEENVTRVEQARGADAEPDAFVDLDMTWVAPADLGPLPEDLRERATLLLSRQLAVAEELVHDITWSKQQRDVAARLAYARTRPSGAYFDNRL